MSFGPKSHSPEIDGVFADLLDVAKRQDIEAYAAAWAGLKPKQRAAIGLECHEALKSMAATVDADFTDMTGTNGNQPHTEESQMVASGWIAIPEAISLDEAHAARIFETVGAWRQVKVDSCAA